MKGTCMADKLGSLQLSPCCWPLILVPPAVLLFLLVVVLLLNIVVCWWWSHFVNFLSISPLFRVCFPNEWTTDTGINLWRRSGWTFPSVSILTVPRRESRSCSFSCPSCSSLSFNNSWTWVSLRLNIQPIDNISSCTICPLTCYRYLVVGCGEEGNSLCPIIPIHCRVSVCHRNWIWIQRDEFIKLLFFFLFTIPYLPPTPQSLNTFFPSITWVEREQNEESF